MTARPTDARYCPVCGKEVAVHGPEIERFGEAFCSEIHAEEFAREVRQRRVARAVAAATSAIPESGGPVRSAWRPTWVGGDRVHCPQPRRLVPPLP